MILQNSFTLRTILAQTDKGRPDLSAMNLLAAGRARYIQLVAHRSNRPARELYRRASEALRLRKSRDAGKYVGGDRVAGGIRNSSHS